MTSLQALPMFLHPSVVTFVDDEQILLDTINLEFGRLLRCKFFQNELSAKQHLLNQMPSTHFRLGTHPDVTQFSQLEEDELATPATPYFLALLNQVTRFDQPSVLVVDFNMPHQNGLEICRALNEHPVMKIMLTGAPDQKLAVSAFNEGIIQKFFLKSDPDLWDALIRAIEELKTRHFLEMGRPLYNALSKDLQQILKSLNFLRMFQEILEKTRAIEWYLIDTSGSFLFIDRDGHKTYLVLQSEQQTQKYRDIIEASDDDEFFQKMTASPHILAFFNMKDFKKPLHRWAEHLVPAQRLNEQFWYGLTDQLPADSLGF